MMIFDIIIITMMSLPVIVLSILQNNNKVITRHKRPTEVKHNICFSVIMTIMLLSQSIIIPFLIFNNLFTDTELLINIKPIKHEVKSNPFTFLQQRHIIHYCLSGKNNVIC